MLAFLAISGCASTSRLPAPPSRLSTAEPVGVSGEVRFSFDSPEAFRLHSIHTFARVKEAVANGHINILALSGGGSGGAFGAGVLVGWTRSGTRPTFQLVTGVSVGALIAPFAFLGSDWDPQLEQALSGEGNKGLMQRNLIGALFGASLYSGKTLEKLVNKFTTDELLSAVAREYRRGRMLLIETTDLDKGEPVIWNMGAIADQGGPEAHDLFCKILIASASIPTVFPPVLIRVREDGVVYDEMHVDGSTSVSVFVAPEVGALVTEGAPHMGDADLYVIVNGKLDRFPQTSRNRTLDILASGFETNLTHSIRAALALSYTFARNYGMNFKVTALPAGYPFDDPLDFNPDTMHRLFTFASECAAEGKAWGELGPMIHEAIIAQRPAPNATPDCPVPNSIADTGAEHSASVPSR